MKNDDIKALNDGELGDKLKSTRAELFNLRFQLATGQLDNTGRIAAIKKDIARLQTEMRSRELAAQRQAS